MLQHVPAPIGRALASTRAGEESLTYHHPAFAEVPEALHLILPGAGAGGVLDPRHTADGAGISPALSWRLAGDAASLVLIVEDADSPSREPLVHAIAWRLDPSANLPDGALAGDSPIDLGRNSYMRLGWLPPDPPTGHGEHRYVFQLFALDTQLDFASAPGRAALIRAMDGHVLAKGRATATYARPDTSEAADWAPFMLAGAGLAGLAVAALATRRRAQAREGARLKLVARFDHQVTGVAVSETGRVFVNFPRWTEDSPVSVAELVDGKLRPYPDARWNAWRNARKNELEPEDRWVCVQSVVADHLGSLWVLDPAAPATSHLVPGGAKLVRIDLATDEVTRVYPFGEEIAPEGSYLNDVRFAPDGRTAYLTDSGAKGALIVLDLESGRARRLLSGHPTTMPDPKVTVHADGKPMRRADGRGAEFAADGIEISPDGAYLYWQALTGRILHRVPTDALRDEGLADAALADRIQRVAEVGPNDGYWMDKQGRLYLSAIEEQAVKRLRPEGGIELVVQDPRLRWPDSFAEGPDGRIYVTSSHIMDNHWFDPSAGPAISTELWVIEESD